MTTRKLLQVLDQAIRLADGLPADPRLGCLLRRSRLRVLLHRRRMRGRLSEIAEKIEI